MATGGGVLVRLNVATSCSARKDDARRVALSLVVGVVIQTGDEGIVNPSIQYKMQLTSGAWGSRERLEEYRTFSLEVAPISQPSYMEKQENLGKPQS
jgi:hypothetical protein